MEDVPEGMCVCGNPGRVICTLDFYRSACKRYQIPDYNSNDKRKQLEQFFWNKQNTMARDEILTVSRE